MLHPFSIHIPQATLNDLQQRLERTRWPDEVSNTAWDYGTNLAYLKDLVNYWQTQYDWRAQETKLNQFAQFKANIDGLELHFIHERGKGANPLPLLLLHGWPDSFYRFHKVIPLLTDPTAHGGNAEDAFDIIVPSIPGYAFSERVRDVGSGLTEQIALQHAAQVAGIHLTDIPYLHLFTVDPKELSQEEQQYLATAQAWGQLYREGENFMNHLRVKIANSREQMGKPQQSRSQRAESDCEQPGP